MVGKSEGYELESILSEIDFQGYVVIHLHKLYRLLGKWNRSPEIWKELLNVWEKIGSEHQRSDLHIFETDHEYLVISKIATEPVVKKAHERD